MADELPKLSISIVHHDGLAMLRDCLHSLYAHPPGTPYEVLIVDNVSTDGAVEMLRTEFPQARLLQNRQRQGFGANHNQAILASRGETILLLNDDTRVHPGALDALTAYLEAHPRTALVGPRLLNADGSLQVSCYRFPSPLRCLCESLLLTTLLPDHPLWGDYRAWRHDTCREVDFVSGAAMLVRRAAIGEAGLFDPRFFMYAEETDWQQRMRARGWKIAFCPDAAITHLGGQSSANLRDRQFCEFLRSGVQYMRKHYGPGGVLVQRLAMLMGAGLRLLLFGTAYLVFPRKRSSLRESITLSARLLRWWSGLGPHQGLGEQTVNPAPGAMRPEQGSAGG